MDFATIKEEKTQKKGTKRTCVDHGKDVFPPESRCRKVERSGALPTSAASAADCSLLCMSANGPTGALSTECGRQTDWSDLTGGGWREPQDSSLDARLLSPPVLSKVPVCCVRDPSAPLSRPMAHTGCPLPAAVSSPPQVLVWEAKSHSLGLW